MPTGSNGGPPEGFSFFVTWGIIEWLITSIFAAGAAVAGWVWHLGGRIKDLERENAAMKEEIKELEGLLRALTNRIDELREEIPSKQFVEGQLYLLQSRLDRMMDVKLAGR